MVQQHLNYQNKFKKRIAVILVVAITSALVMACENENSVSNDGYRTDTEAVSTYEENTTEIQTMQAENETEKNDELNKKFFTYWRTGDSQIIYFAYDYSETWEYIDRSDGSGLSDEEITDKKGAKITLWQNADVFSQYYGGGYIVEYAKADKVAECNFKPERKGDEEKLGDFCVAKIKIYASEDGLSDEGKKEFDGPTYYAIIPEEYLGEMSFSASTGAIYAACTWSYYGGNFALIAESESGEFSEDEENQIISFLSTFRQEYE